MSGKIGIWLIGVALLAINPFTWCQLAADDVQLNRLIAELNHSHFETRQRASSQLIEMGLPAVPALVKQVISGKPEPAMRSAKILQQIGIRGDESSLMRIALLYRLLADQGYDQFADRAVQLKRQWKTMRARHTVERLEQLGAQVSVMGTVDMDIMFLDTGVAKPEIFDLNEPPSVDKPARPMLTQADVLEQVADIIEASDEVNQARLAKVTADAAPSRPSADPRRNSIVVDGAGRFVMGSSLFHADSDEEIYTVDIGPEFNGGDSDLELLQLLPNVQQIKLRDRKLTPQLIQVLRASDNLTVLTLENVDFELQSLLAFMRSKPQLYVQTAGTAFLGVTAENDLESGLPTCRIESIIPDSAASEAGIMTGDMIRSIDDVKIQTFQQLVVAIAAYAPGDEISIEIDRSGQPHSLTAKLKPRPPDLFR